MKITLKTTHFNIELSPDEISDTALNQLLEAVQGGWPANNDTIGIIVRDYRATVLSRSAAKDSGERPERPRGPRTLEDLKDLMPPTPLRTQPVKPDPS